MAAAEHPLRHMQVARPAELGRGARGAAPAAAPWQSEPTATVGPHARIASMAACPCASGMPDTSACWCAIQARCAQAFGSDKWLIQATVQNMHLCRRRRQQSANTFIHREAGMKKHAQRGAVRAAARTARVPLASPTRYSRFLCPRPPPRGLSVKNRSGSCSPHCKAHSSLYSSFSGVSWCSAGLNGWPLFCTGMRTAHQSRASAQS